MSESQQSSADDASHDADFEIRKDAPSPQEHDDEETRGRASFQRLESNIQAKSVIRRRRVHESQPGALLVYAVVYGHPRPVKNFHLFHWR